MAGSAGAAAGGPDEGHPGAVRLGMWGATAAGKTTFLAALFLAASRLTGPGGRPNPLNVVPQDGVSEEFMIRHSHMLQVERRFPVSTLTQSPLLAWRMAGDLRGTVFAHRWLPFLGRHVPLEFSLLLRDVPGEYFRTLLPDVESSGERSLAALAFLDELAECQGLLYLFDPVRGERSPGGSMEYFDGALTRLKARVLERGGLIGDKLPHYVSVCITKFDDEVTYLYSKDTRLVRGRHPNDGGQPSIRLKDAETYADMLCKRVGGSAPDVLNQLRGAFLPERIRFYAVSSVGFYSARDGDGRPRAAESNAMPSQDGGTAMIRSRPRPINVLEAVVDLERAIRGTGR